MTNKKASIFTGLVLVNIFWSCSYGEEPTVIEKVKVGGEYGEILVKQSISNATTNESIQLWTKENRLSIFERYDLFEGHYILNDSLFIIVSDTSGINIQKDTLTIRLK